ncbi:uncharacterized protein LOC109203881 [Oreochromis niloticus]|uniref:uncharacterized protein LOC109203881 n=1 Tax=Oreochromis niloticus TaxID=8128 RepID=UPI000DF307FA|nr:uncharacterized protein LOC109203881 [Oreochromis niloticus]
MVELPQGGFKNFWNGWRDPTALPPTRLTGTGVQRRLRQPPPPRSAGACYTRCCTPPPSCYCLCYWSACLCCTQTKSSNSACGCFHATPVCAQLCHNTVLRPSYRTHVVAAQKQTHLELLSGCFFNSCHRLDAADGVVSISQTIKPICLSTYNVYAIFVSVCAVKREWERERRGVREKEKEGGIKRR